MKTNYISEREAELRKAYKIRKALSRAEKATEGLCGEERRVKIRDIFKKICEAENLT